MLCVLNTLFLILIPARHVNNNENNHENCRHYGSFYKVFDPASASGVAEPAVTAAALKSSYHLPIIGIMSEVEKHPAPPINDSSPNAPVLGRYSDTKPSMVGQKNRYRQRTQRLHRKQHNRCPAQ